MTRLDPRPTRQDRAGSPYPTPDVIDSLPILILYPHNRCNCRCIMCDIWRLRDTEEITTAEVERWIPDLAALGVGRVVLSGGEPLMCSDLAGTLAVLREAGIGITLLSTGLLLRRYADDVVRHCDDVVVSLDGPQEIHDRIRQVPGAFTKLRDGVAALRAAGGTVRVTARCTVQRANARFLGDTVAAARGLGLDGVSFLAADVSTEAFNRPGGVSDLQHNQVAVPADALPDLRSELERMEREYAAAFHDGFILESPEKLRERIYDYYRALHGDGAFPAVRCNAPWVSSVVEADGTVRPCFFHPPFGNVRAQGGIKAVVNSPEAVAFRQGLDVSRDPICRRCVCSLDLRRAE